MSYHWPGNIRELENIIERLVIVEQNDFIECKAVQRIISRPGNNNNLFICDIMPMKTAVAKTEKILLKKALEKHKTTRKVGEALQISQSTVVKKLQKYGIPVYNKR